MIEQAASTRPFVLGVPLGKTPSRFVIGDVCTQRDQILGRPFTGALGEVFTNLLATLKCEASDCYVTYLVKAVCPQGTLSVKEIEDSWLPIARHEYALSGCTQVVAVGKIVRQYAGHIPVRPSELPAPYRPGILTRVVNAWRALSAS